MGELEEAWPLLLLFFVIGGTVMRLIDGGEIRGLKSSNQFLKDQLELATKKQSEHSQEISGFAPEIAELKGEMAELRRGQTELKDTHAPQIARLSTTVDALEQRLATVTSSNNALGQILHLEGRALGRSTALGMGSTVWVNERDLELLRTPENPTMDTGSVDPTLFVPPPKKPKN